MHVRLASRTSWGQELTQIFVTSTSTSYNIYFYPLKIDSFQFNFFIGIYSYGSSAKYAYS